ncbi:cyclic GMP-AMP synthase DncV-like nucleotidyltransferase [Niveibacterium sp. SC-1]|uniref:cyclic GMP-AMP synthase DncV-like nucleotidyltransferase n=1 Tax=Niveibacterium sp. SC-1 TaxID=3135646 RepID=UPI00311D5BF0
MADINCNAEMTAYHRDEVTLSLKQQQDMRARRNTGRTRLENGLNTAGKPQPREVQSQGSYQMRTMVQDPENDYDIDDGAYFRHDDLKDDEGLRLSPLAARQRVCDALKWDGRFNREAEVKNNCVRQAYAVGYHIDVPVYRILVVKDWQGNETEQYELASGDAWVISDARAVTRWFNNKVKDLNGSDSELSEGQADGSQLRRVTKLTKKFARRADWKAKTTSGITITKLVVDHFVASADRDDTALRETWKNINSALLWSTQVAHPVVDKNLAENGDEQVTHFRTRLKEALDTLAVLDKEDCTRAQARQAWDDVFDTTFFSDQPDPDAAKKAAVGNSVMEVTKVETARRNDGGGRFG